MSWFIPYSKVFTPSLSDFIYSPSKPYQQWVGPVDAIVALAYKRFRPGAKLKIENFRITNDHSYSVNILDYNIDWQSIKRTFMGGKAVDLINLKNPIYYSFQILNLLEPEKSKLLLDLALQSTKNLIRDTYAKDALAQEYLHQIQLIIQTALDRKDLSSLTGTLNISECYLTNPLTVKNMEMWQNNLKWLEEICDEFIRALEKYNSGEDVEGCLSNIKRILEKPRQEMEEYYNKIIKGT